MVASTRMLNAILDRMLQLLPDEPADSKRLDDIQDDLVEVDASAPSPEASGSVVSGAVVSESVIPVPGIRKKLRAAS
jgi:hypothetical protein